MMSLGPGIPSPVTLLFNFPTRSIMSIINRVPISIDSGNKHQKALVKDKQK